MNKTYVIKKCLYCSNIIPKRPTESIPLYNKRKFCRLACQHKWNKENKSKKIKCSFCGKFFKRKQSAIKKYNFCSLKCFHNFRHYVGTELVKCDWCNKEFRKLRNQISKTKRNFCSRQCFGLWQSKFVIGENSYGWKGGIATLNSLIRSSKKMINFRLNVFKRDNFQCQVCKDKKGGNLNVHHIKKISDIIKEKNIKNIYEALRDKDLWDITNGITLCNICHQKIHKGELNYDNIKRTIQ